MNRSFLYISLLLSSFFCGFVMEGYSHSESGEPDAHSTVVQKDIRQLFQRGNHQVIGKDTTALKGDGPFVSVMPVVGYSLQSGLTGAIVSNTSFYTDASHSKFSSLLLNAYYSQYHQYWFTANTNIFLEKKKLHFYGDTRYYNFPTQTFGLGPGTTLSDALDIKYSYLRVYQSVYKEIGNNYFVGFGYNLDKHWNIKVDSIPGKALNDLKKYQKTDHSTSSGISFNLIYDNRQNAVNPDKGSFAYLQIRPNLKLLGSDNDWQSILFDFRHYIRFPASTRNVIAFWNYNNFTTGGYPPYLDIPSVGWDNYSNTGRGYVPGRYMGRNFMYLETEYRFALTRNGMLGGVVFGNEEALFKTLSTMKNPVPGYGLGLRIKINRFSNTNLAIDYGFGVGGSHGFFFNLGEIF